MKIYVMFIEFEIERVYGKLNPWWSVRFSCKDQ